jgi:hypothetical protein
MSSGYFSDKSDHAREKKEKICKNESSKTFAYACGQGCQEFQPMRGANWRVIAFFRR